MLINYANTRCVIVSETEDQVKLLKEGETIKRITIGGYCGVEKKTIETNTVIAGKNSRYIQPIKTEE